MSDPTRTDYRSLYDKDFIGAWDLEGGDLTVTIKRCKGGELTAPGGKKSRKPVIYMMHTDKGFALNATNGKTIAALYGKYVEAWVGKRITLYKSMTRFGADENIECIRVRPAIPSEDQKTAAPQAPTPPVPPYGGPVDAAALILPNQAMELEAWASTLKAVRKFKLKFGIEMFSQLPASKHAEAQSWLKNVEDYLRTQG